MKKIITITVLSIIIVLVTIFIISPKKTFSEIENRSLAKIPKLTIKSIFDGTYMKDIETYLNDHFPLRTYFISIKTTYSKAIGKQDINNVYLGEDNYLLEKYETVNYQEAISNTVNKLQNNNPETKISIMLIPTKISIYSDKLPKNIYPDNQTNIINNIYRTLNKSITTITLYDELINEKNNYQLYYKTDHHWTSYGAYIAYKEFAIKNNIEYIDISNHQKETVTNKFKGSTYSKVVDPFCKGEKIDIFTYKNYNLEVNYVMSKKQTTSIYNYDYLKKKDKYAFFLDNNHPLITIANNDIQENNILIIKDSYANSMIQFLVNHYHEIHIIDPRYYKKSISKYIEENNIKNILVMYNVGTLSTDTNILSIR